MSRTFHFVCSCCNKVKEGRIPEPKTEGGFIWRPDPLFICDECVRKEIVEDSVKEITDA